jgi:hypothetical protein
MPYLTEWSKDTVVFDSAVWKDLHKPISASGVKNRVRLFYIEPTFRRVRRKKESCFPPGGFATLLQHIVNFSLKSIASKFQKI